MLTVFFAVLDVRQGTLTYANGGHEPPLVRDSSGKIEELDLEGRALAVACGCTYAEASRTLQPGDTVVMITDGITEARTDGCVFFGKEGVIRYLRENRTAAIEEIPSGLLQAATAHAGGVLQDDAAVVAFELEDARAQSG